MSGIGLSMRDLAQLVRVCKLSLLVRACSPVWSKYARLGSIWFKHASLWRKFEGIGKGHRQLVRLVYSSNLNSETATSGISWCMLYDLYQIKK